MNGLNTAHIDELDNLGHKVKTVGTITYDPKTGTLEGNGISNRVVSCD